MQCEYISNKLTGQLRRKSQVTLLFSMHMNCTYEARVNGPGALVPMEGCYLTQARGLLDAVTVAKQPFLPC